MALVFALFMGMPGFTKLEKRILLSKFLAVNLTFLTLLLSYKKSTTEIETPF